jgi:hypothetical protein
MFGFHYRPSHLLSNITLKWGTFYVFILYVCTERLVGPRAGLDAEIRGKILCLWWELNPEADKN